MDRRFLIIVAVIVGIFGFLTFGPKKSNSSSSNNKATVSNHSTGLNKKGVEIVEFGDFQCPYCGQYFPVVEQVRKKYGDDIKFTFKHFPLENVHQNARAAHRAAEAAGMQGKFWEMYDKIYSNQSEWASASVPMNIFEGYAKEIALDTTKYKQDYASSIVNDTINADVELAKSFKITGTPSFVINGKLIETPNRSVDAFSEAIDKAIKEVSGQATATPSPSVTPTPTPVQ